MIFPQELTSDVPRITLTGRQMVFIEQHKGLIGYQEDNIALRSAAGMVCISGKDLCFRRYTATEAVIVGEIDGITLQEGRSK